jgi:hypothetical protein
MIIRYNVSAHKARYLPPSSWICAVTLALVGVGAVPRAELAAIIATTHQAGRSFQGPIRFPVPSAQSV